MVTVLTCVMPAMLLILTGSSGASASLLASSREMTVRSDPVSTTKLNGPLPSMCIGKEIRRDMTQPVAIMVGALLRSEEHTSELQSLMSSSYAVFCLKKRTTTANSESDNVYARATTAKSDEP